MFSVSSTWHFPFPLSPKEPKSDKICDLGLFVESPSTSPPLTWFSKERELCSFLNVADGLSAFQGCFCLDEALTALDCQSLTLNSKEVHSLGVEGIWCGNTEIQSLSKADLLQSHFSSPSPLQFCPCNVKLWQFGRVSAALQWLRFSVSALTERNDFCVRGE